jgi:hypothetical protein
MFKNTAIGDKLFIWQAPFYVLTKYLNFFELTRGGGDYATVKMNYDGTVFGLEEAGRICFRDPTPRPQVFKERIKIIRYLIVREDGSLGDHLFTAVPNIGKYVRLEGDYWVEYLAK